MEEKRREAGSLSPASESARSGGASAAADDSTISRRRGGGLKRKASSSSASPASAPPSKRAYRDKWIAALQPHQIHNGPLTRARQLSDSAATLSALGSAKNEPLPAVQAACQELEELSAAKKVFEDLEAALESQVEAIRSRDDNAHVIPVPAGWFSWNNIHPIEKHALPSFFDGKSESRSPETYVEIRNWIMNKFHANPSLNIESKDLTESSTGELDAQREIMEFLDYWGLINYHPFLPKDNAENNTAANTDGDEAEKMDSGSVIEQLYQFEIEQSFPVLVPRASLSAPAIAAGFFPESAIVEELGKQEGPSVEYHCNFCSADCSRKRYHCQKQADFDLCGECYNNRKFGSHMSSSDFILMEFAEVSSASGGRWTDQETLLLLEALELYKENWNEIAEHVATKTKAQCILHFLQVPIEDNFRDCDNEIKDSLQQNADPNTTISDTSGDPNSTKVDAVADQGSTKIDSSVPKDASGTSENRTGSGENQPAPSPMEISKKEDTRSVKINQEVDKEFGVKTLKEAFEAVGCLPSPEDKFSFAEGGNPVMSLAAFLIRLVDPCAATVSARSSIKSMDSSSPGLQLALRHSFILEDPPDNKKENVGSESVAADKVGQDTQKEEKQEDKDVAEMKQTEENSTTQNENSTEILDSNDLTRVHVDDKVNSGADGNPLAPPIRQDESAEKPHTTEKPNEKASDELDRLKIVNESRSSDLSKDQAADAIKESIENLASSVEHAPGSAQQVKATSAVEDTLSKEGPRDVNVDSNSIDLVKKQESDPAVSLAGDGAKTVDDKIIDAESGSKSLATNDGQNIDKVKHAAIATLAAAAVKAKLLANQEEDEIQHIAALLIEKQLRKLAVKLSFFADMENAIVMVKEHLDRARLKLYHERDQIIARLGLPSSSSRPLPSVLPVGRGAMGPGNPMMRPPMNMATLRPPMTKPMMTSVPVTSVHAAASTMAGRSSTQHSSQ